MQASSVKKHEIISALKQIGIKKGDMVLVHSSLKSMGYVDGGAYTVICAFLDLLESCGTLVMPTLVQEDFPNAYETWYLDKPSETGYITEVFRTMPGVLRSDQATHSVAAKGDRAQELVKGHTEFGLRFGIFGDTAFSRSSPWQKLYDWNAKVVFVGIDMRVNTGKHLIEYILIEEALSQIKDPDKKAVQKAKIRDYTHFNDESLVWPFFDGLKHQQALEELGLIKKTRCGNAKFICCPIGDSLRLLYRLAKDEPDKWFSPEMLEWFRDCNYL